MPRKVNKQKVNTKIAGIKNPINNISKGDTTMGKLQITKDTAQVNSVPQEAIATLLKVMVVYHENDKQAYLGKWKNFFIGLFPNDSFKSKNGMWTPAIYSAAYYKRDKKTGDRIGKELGTNGAIAFLVEKGYVNEIGKQFKNGSGKLYSINPDKLEKIFEILENFARDFDEQLMTEIDAFYAEQEGDGGSFENFSSDFSDMGF